MKSIDEVNLVDFVCLTSHCKCNSKCDDCSECDNKIDKWLEEHDKQIRAELLKPYDVESIEELVDNSYNKGKADAIEEAKQKQRVIIDDDGVMYKVVFLKDIEEMKAEIKE